VPVAQLFKYSLKFQELPESSYFIGMQGKKNYQEKLFNNFQLSVRVPVYNFTRSLYESQAPKYGRTCIWDPYPVYGLKKSEYPRY